MWWQSDDRPAFADESKLLILADAGGSNGYRPRLWKQQLQQQLADQLGVEVMVCHYPTGASKWNPIEHALFSHISLNWAGQPLRSFDTIVNFIANTTTQAGLNVSASLIERTFERGLKISDKEMATLNLLRRPICPRWNYIIQPRPAPV